MERILQNNLTYTRYEYSLEKEFEQIVIEQATHIFGHKAVYVDIKKKIGKSIVTIPDGYLIDFTFPSDPKLYIIEIELASHDLRKHIAPQLMSFALGYKASGRKIKQFILEHLSAEQKKMVVINEGISKGGHRNIDALLEHIIFEKPVATIVIIDHISQDLEDILSQFTMSTDILEFQTFKHGQDCIYKFTPFNADLREISESKNATIDINELNTVVVAAREDGFEKEFMGNEQWFAIRIHSSMLDKIRYIAAYQVAPISAITHYAEVASIERWNDTNKYILKFKAAPIKVKPIPLDNSKKGLAPQAPRYTSIDKLKKAKSMGQVF